MDALNPPQTTYPFLLLQPPLRSSTQTATWGRPGTRAPATSRDTRTARRVWHGTMLTAALDPAKPWESTREISAQKKCHFIHRCKATQDCAFLRRVLPSPLLCSPGPLAEQEAQDDPATTGPTAHVCPLSAFCQSSDLCHQARRRAKGDAGIHARGQLTLPKSRSLGSFNFFSCNKNLKYFTRCPLSS